MSENALELKERQFIRAMDDIQAYLSVRRELNGTLRSGFIDLASCRHALGRQRVGLAQLPMKMTAFQRIHASQSPDDERLEMFEYSKAAPGDDTRAHSGALPPPAGTSEFGDGILAELAAQFECTTTGRRDEPNESLPPDDPLQWYGGELTLQPVQQGFRRALALMLEAVNARRRAEASITQYMKYAEAHADNFN